MLELAILGLLKDQELHGYELKKRLGETLGPLSRVSFGSLYPALRRLARSGAVEVVEGAEPSPVGVPSAGSLAGELAAFRARRSPGRETRGRKVYRITADGEALFSRLLAEADGPDDDRAFNLRLAFARHLAADERLGMLERRRAHLVERLVRAQAAVRAGRERWDRYARSIAEHSTEATERDISWIDRLIEAERSGEQDADPGGVGDTPMQMGAER
ncbi:MAG TPA: PadR family transcriptional regulator [Acidimicrobiales bacterium]|nr:PadR family transcriptional regulator [Acidimicrobiales bacterium]